MFPGTRVQRHTVYITAGCVKNIECGGLENEEPDLNALRNYITGSAFDLCAINDNVIFGCIQAKTSVRDRVTRDSEPSLKHSMNHFFWSIIFVLDGHFLSYFHT